MGLPNLWPDFEGNQPPVSQLMLCEYRKLEERVAEIEEKLLLARIDAQAVGREIEELMILGGGVEPGKWVPILNGGKLRVVREEEFSESAVPEPPF